MGIFISGMALETDQMFTKSIHFSHIPDLSSIITVLNTQYDWNGS